jgi:predicted nucleic acid-binding protein
MRIVVSDSSCLIDLKKVSLLSAFLRLPFEFLIPNTLFEEELLQFSASQKKSLLSAGLQIVDLPGNLVMRARQLVGEMPSLSVHDGFAFALAESRPDCILLSGDGKLRSLARKKGLETHGVLWVLDEIHRCKVTGAASIAAALRLFLEDPTVRLPRQRVRAYLKKYNSIK